MIRRCVLYSFGALAIALILTGATWKWLFPPETYWNREQAQSLVDAFDAVHRAEDSQPHGPGDPGADEFLAARRRYEALKHDLDRARTARDQTGTYLAVAGVAVAVATYLLGRYWEPPADANPR